MRMLAPAQNTRSLPDGEHHRLDLRVLEAQPLHRVGQLDIDAQVVGVELELVALEQRGGLIDVHDEVGHLAVELELPVAIVLGLGLELDALGHRGVTPDPLGRPRR